jgi:hypothetical protein
VANKELRVYMNNQNKVAAIKSMDWNDVFEENYLQILIQKLNSSSSFISKIIQIEDDLISFSIWIF